MRARSCFVCASHGRARILISTSSATWKLPLGVVEAAKRGREDPESAGDRAEADLDGRLGVAALVGKQQRVERGGGALVPDEGAGIREQTDREQPLGVVVF